ncbi:MAG: hypothetical protein ACOYD4_00975 [Solirubrobacterales bacterium]
MRLAVPIAIAVLAASLAGCGGSSPGTGSTATGSTAAPQGGAATAPAGASAQSCETQAVDAEALRATGASCEEARQVMFAWQRDSGCAGSAGASHAACTVRSYRCIATRADRGLAVSCAGPGRSIAFIAKRG